MAAKKQRVSRLLVKFATGIDRFGEDDFELKIDSILSGEKKRVPAVVSKNPEDKGFFVIIRSISSDLSIPVKTIRYKRSHKGEAKFATSLAVYLIKIKLNIPVADISAFFGRKSHSFVNDCTNHVIAEYKEKLEIIQRIEKAVETNLAKKK